MILGYADKRTETFARGGNVPGFQAFGNRLSVVWPFWTPPPTSLEDLRVLPSNHLEALRGDRRGRWSIRINRQWRICFSWPAGSPGPMQVEIVDYH